MTIQRFDVGARLSEMAVHNGTVYLAGQVAADASQDIAGQTAQVLAAIRRSCRAPGAARASSCTCRSSSPTWRTSRP